MSFIREIEEPEATGEIGAMYERLRAERGRVSNILKAHSLRPQALAHHLDLYMGLLFGPGRLSRAQREMIAVVVSATNDCAYCVSHHREALSRYVRDPAQLDAICTDHRGAGLPEATVALLDYARRLTAAPATTTEADIEALRTAGFADEDILHANLIAAYFNFVNRIALGLGVAHNADEIQGYKV
jgi:uncharacterized peroxidase-related enzyme